VHLVGFVIRRVFLIVGLLAVEQVTSYLPNLQNLRQKISIFARMQQNTKSQFNDIPRCLVT